jgi:hypothetical protein
LGYSEVSIESVKSVLGNGSVVHALNRILFETSEKELDKPALSEVLEKRLSSIKEKIPKLLKELFGALVSEASVLSILYLINLKYPLRDGTYGSNAYPAEKHYQPSRTFS